MLMTFCEHYNDIIMSTMASQITSLTIVYSTVYSGGDQRQNQSCASLAFAPGIHRCPSLSNFKAISWFKLPIFENFVTSRELTIRRPVLYWKDSCIIFCCLQHHSRCAAKDLSDIYQDTVWWYVHTSNHCPLRRCNYDIKSVIFEHILYIKLMSTSCGITLRWMSKNLEW